VDLQSFISEFKVKKKDFAGDLGISCGHLSKLLGGDARPSLELAIDIDGLTNGKVTPFDWDCETDLELNYLSLRNKRLYEPTAEDLQATIKQARTEYNLSILRSLSPELGACVFRGGWWTKPATSFCCYRHCFACGFGQDRTFRNGCRRGWDCEQVLNFLFTRIIPALGLDNFSRKDRKLLAQGIVKDVALVESTGLLQIINDAVSLFVSKYWATEDNSRGLRSTARNRKRRETGKLPEVVKREVLEGTE
jgi:transcriptional regulator with XRE-family HTH domain